MTTDKLDFPSNEAFRQAALTLQCEEAAIRAVAEVESGPYGAFLQNEEGQPPVILFERHKFDRHTTGKYRGAVFSTDPKYKRYAIISWPARGGYGPVSVQHAKLQAAVKLDQNGALCSASYGLFQILGENYAQCGYDSVQEMVNDAWRSVDDHLKMFVRFILADRRLLNALRGLDFRTFKRVYNGRAENGYEVKMQQAYLRQRSIHRA